MYQQSKINKDHWKGMNLAEIEYKKKGKPTIFPSPSVIFNEGDKALSCCIIDEDEYDTLNDEHNRNSNVDIDDDEEPPIDIDEFSGSFDCESYN